jgi:hypothetical protein
MKIFENQPNLEKCFSTSDGEHFYNENDAKNHARSLDEKSVEPVYNPNFLEVVISDDSHEDDLAEQKLKESENMVKELEDTELVKSNYQILKKLVQYFKIDVADQKSETLIEALKEYKSKIKE